MDEDAQLAHPAKPIDQFVDTTEVADKDGSTVSVPNSFESNRQASRVVGARLRDLLLDQIQYIKKSRIRMPPEDLKHLVAAAAKVEDVNRMAFSLADLGEQGNEATNSAVKAAQAMMRGLGEGIMSSKKNDRMQKLRQVGKKKPPENQIVESEENVVEIE